MSSIAAALRTPAEVTAPGGCGFTVWAACASLSTCRTLFRDGDADVVVGGRWFENDGRVEGTWRRHLFTTDRNWADTKVALGDVNRDGFMDVVLAPAEYRGQRYRLA